MRILYQEAIWVIFESSEVSLQLGNESLSYELLKWAALFQPEHSIDKLSRITREILLIV